MTSLEQFEKTLEELSFGHIDLAGAIRDVGITIDNLVGMAARLGIKVSAQEVADVVSGKISQQHLYLYPPSDHDPANLSWTIYDSNTDTNFTNSNDPTDLRHAEAIRLAKVLLKIDIASIVTRIMTA
jgi:hypothetical protein